jgi:hypothetical protein
MYDVVNPDQSIEVHTYKMIGVGILAFNNWGVYKCEDINADNWYKHIYPVEVTEAVAKGDGCELLTTKPSVPVYTPAN